MGEREERLRALLTRPRGEREEHLRELLTRPALPKNPAPVGRKIISALQMRQIIGVDTRRSLDSTLQSQKSPNSSQLSQDSLFATPIRQGGSKLVPKASRRDRIQEQRAYAERMERLIGPRDPNAKFVPPKPEPLDESSADEFDEEAKENAIQPPLEAVQANVDEENSVVEEPSNVPEASQLEVTAEETPFAGSQGRYGLGCSTPKNVNNTLAPFRQIDVSAVSLDGSSTNNRGVIRSESSEGGEPMEVDEGEPSMNNVFAQFKGKTSKSHNNGKEESEQGGTFTIVKESLPESRTFSIRRDDGTFNVNENKSFSGENKEGTHKNDTFVVDQNTLCEEAGTFVVEERNNDASRIKAPDPPAPVLVHEDLPGPSHVAEKMEKSVAAAEKKSFGLKRSGFGALMHNLSSIPSPGSNKFGFSKRPVHKVSRISSPEKPRRRDTVSPNIREKTIEMSNVFNAEPSMADLDGSSMIDAFTDPRERNAGPPDTPKSAISRPTSRLSRSNSRMGVLKPKTPSTTPLPHYAKHTAASRNRSLFVPTDEESDRTASFNEIDPDDMMVHQGMKSGYRPRQSMAARKAFNHLRTMNKSLADPRNETVEERRRHFLERRANGESRANQGTPLRIMVQEQREEPVAAREPEETNDEQRQEEEDGHENVDVSMDALHKSARKLSLHEDPEEAPAPKENVTATVLIGPEQPLPLNDVMGVANDEFDFAPQPDDDDDIVGAYEDDDVEDETELVVRRPQQQLMNSLFSRAPDTPVHHRRRELRGADVTIVDEDSMAEEDESQGEGTEMVLKPRRLIRPESPEDGLRRSKRNRIAPVRYYLGEKAVYEDSPNRGPRLVGTSKVVIRDQHAVKMRTTNPVKFLDRQKKEERKKKERREQFEDPAERKEKKRKERRHRDEDSD